MPQFLTNENLLKNTMSLSRLKNKEYCILLSFIVLNFVSPFVAFVVENDNSRNKFDILEKQNIYVKDALSNSSSKWDSSNLKTFPDVSQFKQSESPFAGCIGDAYPPKENTVQKFAIDLSKPPKERWRELIEVKRSHLKKLVGYMEELMTSLLGQRIFQFVNESLPQLATTLPTPYYEEIEGIATAGNLTVTQVTMYNIFYEVFTVCTSIITQDKTGHIFHGRNLDFGLFLGWDARNHTWFVGELLRPLVVELEWIKDNRTIFQSVSYTGFIGVITALKKGKFAISLDERFSWNGGYVGLLEWIIFKDYKQKWVSFLIREVMENVENFGEAEMQLMKPRLLAPCYLILSGVEAGQGVIITRFRNDFNILKLGSNATGQGSWLLVETNYDHWKSPPFYDDRRTPSIKCLMEGGQENADWKLMYNVLSTRPVLNKLTTYTTLMDPKKGDMKTWLRDCPDPCWPW